jgi:uncharacterized protein YbjQ (UPF0145 family)
MTPTSQASILVTTVPAIEGRPVQWYLGIVSGEAVGVVRDSASPAADLREARENAILEMLREAAERGANAVIGVDLGYAPVPVTGEGTALMVTVSGTAVRV